jgi:proline racemase
MGMVPMKEPETKFNLESPGGIVKVTSKCQNGQVCQVILESMPSFVGYTDKQVLYYLVIFKNLLNFFKL